MLNQGTVQSASIVIFQQENNQNQSSYWKWALVEHALKVLQARNLREKNPETGYINIVLNITIRCLLLKNSNYTMWVQYSCSKGGIMPWDGADMLRMLQFLELAHSRVRPHILGLKARPRVPGKFLLFIHVVPNAVANYPGCPTPFGGNIPYIGCDSQIGTTKESRVGNYLNTLMTEGS